jgi:hypothetical protein
MTLKQIADQIGVNYKTVLSCKKRFEQFVHGVPVGRIAKYPEDFVDFFRLVFALFDEGYTTGKVQDLLLNGVESEEDAFIESWLEEWRSRLKLNGKILENEQKQSDGLADSLTDRPTDSPTDCLPDSLTDGMTDGLTDSPTDGLPGGLTDSPTDGLPGGLTDSPTDGLTDSLTDCPTDLPTDSLTDGMTDGPTDSLTDGVTDRLTDSPTDGRTDGMTDRLTDSPTDHPTDIHSDICDRVTELIFQYLKEIFGHLETTLQKSTTQTNIAITALCESTQDIRNGLLSINDRLSRLERDLDVEAAEPLEIYEVDARNYQVDLPEIPLPDMTPPSTADLEPGSEPGSETIPETTPDSTPQDQSDDHDLTSVRDSIDNGIPDREVLVDWAMEKRQQDENTYSYNVLAGILNKSAIPTMSGREKWSRSTVRNLLVRTLKNRE